MAQTTRVHCNGFYITRNPRLTPASLTETAVASILTYEGKDAICSSLITGFQRPAKRTVSHKKDQPGHKQIQRYNK